MSFWSKIKSWLSRTFSELARVFKEFAKKVAHIAVKEGAQYILDVARKTVEELSNTQYNNEVKRKKAFKRIKKYAKERGLSIDDRIINKVIEDCVVEYKARF